MTWAGDWLGGEPTENNESDEKPSAPVDDTAPPLVPGSEAEAPVDEVPEPEDALIPLAPPSAVLIAGVAGGVGATTTAVGLASALHTELVTAAAVDTTPAGGDLSGRGCGRELNPGQWVSEHGVLWGRRTLGELSGDAAALESVHSLLTASGHFPIYDAGNPLRAQHLAPLLADASVVIVLVVSSRGDSVNRLPSVLEWIESTLGAHTLASVVVAVVEVRPGSTPVADHLSAHMAGRIGAVRLIGHDRSLAAGGPIATSAMGSGVEQDFTALAADVRNLGAAAPTQ
ncbi:MULTISPECIES: hypothetical protein [Rhodococcus]|uniref:hypothetical protein n=1 Tax=Rhodococcus TaxID=1827 RepID=UPI001C5CC428|nr:MULTISPECIES: hypothetical protein [Rhodococcus]MBW4818176.1 hypothetical protein [Rhodococcus qingshengii]MCJ0906037.1 hypothetical protein [Rhodococcus sp. ARC_M6]